MKFLPHIALQRGAKWLTEGSYKSELKHYLAIPGEKRNMQIFHSVLNSNRLPGNTIHKNHIYQENTGHESYDQMNSTIIYQHLQTVTRPKTEGRIKNGNLKIKKTRPCFPKLITFV